MAFAQSTRSQSWVVKSLVADGVGTHKLLPFQFGIFDYDKSKSISNPNFSNNRKIFFALGSPNDVVKINSGKFNSFANKFNVNQSFKSDVFLGGDFNPLRVEKPQKTLTPYSLYLGYDGLNDYKTLNFECGKTYEIWIQAYSSDLKTVFPQGITDVITLKTPSCDTCDVSCTTGNLAYKVIDEAIAKLNNSLVSPFIRAEKLISCCDPALSLVKTNFEDYNITLCDTGDEIALAELQAAYPDKKITRVSREKTLSTYRFTQLASLGAPANYVQSKLIIPNCPTCAAYPGFTLVAASKLIKVSIDNAGTGTTPANWLTEVQASVATATAATRIAFENGTSTYIVKVPLAWVMPAPVADTVIVDLGITSDPYCTQDTPVSTAWVIGDITYKIKRTLVMQMENPDCNSLTPELTSIVALYSGIDDVVAGSVAVKTAGTCQTIYTLDQWCAEPLTDGCDTIATPKFNGVRSYKGHAWGVDLAEGWTLDGGGCPVPPTTSENNCRVGIKFTGSFFDHTTGTCVIDPTQTVSYDPIRFEVSVSEQLEPGNASTVKAVDAPQTIGASPKFIRLNGRQVLRDVLMSRYYRRENYIHPDSENGWRMQATNGLKYGVDVNAFYYGIIISANAFPNVRNNTMDLGSRREIALWFEEKDLGLMQSTIALLNKYFVSNGMNFPVITV